VAVCGGLFDAHKFIPQVIAQGAIGVISELERPADFNAAWLRVSNVRRAMACGGRSPPPSITRSYSSSVYTRTNGKTTTAYLIASIPKLQGNQWR
jgi:UDP-N-acetylmuramyl tripeptide synthase